MHILFIHQHYSTPEGTCCVRSYELTRRCANEGHKVTVIAGYSDRCGLTFEGGLIKKLSIDGMDIFMVRVKYSNKQSFTQRVWSFLGFVFLSSYIGLKIRDVDVVYAVSTPLTSGIPAMLLRFAKRIPFVFAVSDQWPEIPIELGIIRNKIMIKMLLWLEKTIYKKASAVIALSLGIAEGIKEVFKKYQIPEKVPVAVIPNGCETDTFSVDFDRAAIRKRYGWDDRFVLLHAGAMGIVNSLDFIIDAAVRIREHPEILFVLLGEGRDREKLKARVKELNLMNVEIRPSVAQRQLPEFYVAADVGMVIIGDFPIVQHNSASKFFDSLIAGKPVLLNYSGWQREVIESNNAGLGCKLYDLDEFVEKVLYLNSHREEVLEMGVNARRVGVEKYDRQKLVMEALGIITSVLKNDDKSV